MRRVWNDESAQWEYRCDDCDSVMETVHGGNISMLGQYRIVTGYRCTGPLRHWVSA